jgi:hypothetical protein
MNEPTATLFLQLSFIQAKMNFNRGEIAKKYGLKTSIPFGRIAFI